MCFVLFCPCCVDKWRIEVFLLLWVSHFGIGRCLKRHILESIRPLSVFICIFTPKQSLGIYYRFCSVRIASSERFFDLKISRIYILLGEFLHCIYASIRKPFRTRDKNRAYIKVVCEYRIKS